MSSISTVSFLKRSKVPLSDLEERVIKIGVKEGLAILKATLISTSALTNGLNEVIKSVKASTSAFSAPQDMVRPESNSEAFGIDNGGQSWSAQLPDGSSGTRVVEVPRSPLVDELPLPHNIQPQEPSMNFAKKVTKNTVPVFALRRSTRKRKGTSNG
ncbi:serine/threonine-protein phosphatase [Trifolium repens]|nr:serine/threonine-protein phosphatase [Trifolium repens]